MTLWSLKWYFLLFNFGELICFSGVFGSGLCVLSKYPIISTLFHSWSVNGYVHRLQHGKSYTLFLSNGVENQYQL